MNKKQLYILIGVLALLILVFLFSKNKNSTIKAGSTNFSFNDYASVTSVIIESNNKHVLFLLVDNKWKTQSNAEVNSKKIETLFGALRNLRMYSPVAKAEKQSVIDTITENGTILSLYKNNKKIYSLTFETINNKTVALTKKLVPYYISIHGYNHIQLKEIANNDLDYWADKQFINLKNHEISNVRVSYTSRPENGYIISSNNNQPTLKDFEGNILQAISEDKIRDYLHFFININYAEIDKSEYEPIGKIPEFELEITTTDKQTIILKGFILVNKTTKKVSQQQFAGVLKNNDIVFFNYSDFDPILLSKDYFLKK